MLQVSPWHKKEDGKIYLYEDNKWSEIVPANKNKLNKVAAQVWLALYNLIMEPECRKKYAYTSSNKPTILKLKSLLTEALIDQIPMLVELQKFLEQLTVVDLPATTDVTSSVLIEQVPEIYAKLQKHNWKDMAERQLKYLQGNSPQETEITQYNGSHFFANKLD